jgi:hypothetical protein
MKFVNGILAGLLLSGAALAQQSTGATSAPQNNPSASQAGTSGSPQTASPRFAPGTVIPVELTKSIDAKKAKSGDNVEARVTQDLKAGNGQVIVPKDTKVMGHVTEAQARNKEQKESQVGIVFDRAVMKNGSDVSMPMSIQAIIGPTALNPAPNNAASAGQSTQPSAAGGTPGGNAGGRSGVGSSGSPSPVSPSSAGGEAPAEGQPGTGSNPPITASTQGVVGISNLKLSPTEDGKTGSVVSSEKSNVKLDSGTLMLLRVNQ